MQPLAKNWEKVNFSNDPVLNRKWDALAEMCTGSNKVETGVESVIRKVNKLKLFIEIGAL